MYTERPKQHAVAVHCVISVVPRTRDPNGRAPLLAARILLRRLLSKPRWRLKRQKQSTANDRRSLSSRMPGSKSDVDFGNFDAGDNKRRRWKLPGLALVTTSSAGSAYDASSMPQLLLSRRKLARSNRQQAVRSSVWLPYRRSACLTAPSR
jgi:hypothetical protein